MTLHYTPASIAAALRRAADDLDAIADTPLSGVALQINLRAAQHCGTDSERVATVDVLGRALVGVPGQVHQHEPYNHHKLPYDVAGECGDADVAVYCNLYVERPPAGGDPR